MQLTHMIDGVCYDVVWNGGPLLPDREAVGCAALRMIVEAPGVGWGRVTRVRPKRKKRDMRGRSAGSLAALRLRHAH
jgi:hypothetical protein